MLSEITDAEQNVPDVVKKTTAAAKANNGNACGDQSPTKPTKRLWRAECRRSARRRRKRQSEVILQEEGTCRMLELQGQGLRRLHRRCYWQRHLISRISVIL
eukprot:355067-Pleurochrysis_carterae.AAC.1